MNINNNSDEQNMWTSSNLWIGLAFIVGGIIVLLNQTGVVSFDFNWWALFIIFPAVGSFSSAYKHYRATNNLFDMGVMMPVLIGLFMLALAYNLLSGNGWNFNWNLYFPAIFIVIGLSMIFARSRKESDPRK